MASEWHTLRLGQVCKKIGSGATPRGGSSVYLDKEGVALIRSQNVHNDGFRREGLVYLAAEHAAELGNVAVERDDVLLNITGDSVARACQAASDVLPARVNQHVAIIRADAKVLWPRFLRYVLTSPSMQAEMLALAGAGATRNALTKGMIELFEITAPVDLDEQRAVAHILGTLDDKIELNRRMNETLESIARLTFTSWFVDFDPVRARATGERPASICRRLGLTPDLLALFPDRLVDSDLGEVPEGWEVDELGNLLDVIATGRRPKGGVGSFSRGVPSVGAENILGIGRYDFSKTKYVPEDFYSAMNSGHVQPWDVLLYKDGGKPGDFKPRVSIFGEGFPFRRFAINEHVFRLRSTVFGQALLYFQIEQERVLNDLRHRGAKAAIPGINQYDVKTLKVIVPPKALRRTFDALISPIVASVLRRANESRHLGDARDTLLPKLVSGELRVSPEGVG